MVLYATAAAHMPLSVSWDNALQCSCVTVADTCVAMLQLTAMGVSCSNIGMSALKRLGDSLLWYGRGN